jgi:hypothetical protein
MQAEGEPNIKGSDELKNFRKKLLDRYVALCNQHGNAVSISFNEFWYDFLLRHMVSEIPMEMVYENVCAKLEQSCLLHLHDRDHR